MVTTPEGDHSISFDAATVTTWPIKILVHGQIGCGENIPVRLQNSDYCGYDEVTFVPYAFDIRAHGHKWNGSEYSDLPDTDWMWLGRLELCSHRLVNGAPPEMDIDVDVFGVPSGEVNWDIVREADRSPALEWSVQNGNFGSHPIATKCTAPGKYILRAWVNCGGEDHTTGPDAGEQQREIRIFVENLQLVLHPKVSDFDPQKSGRVMISAALDHKYYTTVKTTKGNTVAQTEDGKIKITAHLTPAYACKDLVVWFRVKDPPDLSPYVTGVADDNKVSANVPEKGKLNGVNGAGGAIARAEVVNINNQTVAAAEVELTITDQHAGNNYIVECSLDTFATAPADATGTLVAWKRVYYRHHKMWKTSSPLIADYGDLNPPPDPPPPGWTPPPSTLYVKNPGRFANGDTVKVFDAADDIGEDVVVSNVNEPGGCIEVGHVYKNYSAGSKTFPPCQKDKGKLASVAKIGANAYYDAAANIETYLTTAYGGDTSGTDGGCFIEFTRLSDGEKTLPWDEKKWPTWEEYFSETYLASTWCVPHVISVTSSDIKAVGDNTTFGASSRDISGSPTYHSIVIFTLAIANGYDAAERPRVTGKVVSHEFGHAIGNVGECTHLTAHDSIAECLMRSPPTVPSGWADIHAEFNMEEINALRDKEDDF